MKSNDYDHLQDEDGRFHVLSELKQESLVSEKLLQSTGSIRVRPMVPGVVMVAIGGRSIMDGSPDVIHSIVEQLIALRAEGVPLIVGVGGR